MVRRYGIPVLDKMIMVDLFKTLFGVLSVIVVIIVSRQFIKVLAMAIAGEVSNQTVLTILGLKIVTAGVKILPVALFIALLMVLGRMYRDQEMAAIASAGGGVGLLYRAVFMLVIPLSVGAMALSFGLAPWAETTIQNIINQDRETADIRGIAAGRFSEYSKGDLVFYVEDISKNGKMHGVFVQNRQHDKLGIITARAGQMKIIQGERYLVLIDGERVQGEPGKVDFILEKFDEFAVRIAIESQDISFGLEAKPSKELWGSREILDIAELQKRLWIPFSVLILSALAIPLAQISPRGGVYGNLLTAFLIYFCYSNLGRISNSWVVNGAIPVWAGYLGLYVFMLLVVALLLARLYGWRWIKLKLVGRNVS
jgi:lipopolysaccharide export system permease protein